MINSYRLYELIQNAGLEPRSYSGRGMYGKQCIGVDFQTNRDLSYIIEACDNTSEAAELFRDMKQDIMGLGMIAYWPYVNWIKGFHDDEENDFSE